MNRWIYAALILFFNGLADAQTAVPNEFQAGQPARAAEVNANFDALEAAIDQNAAAIQQIPAGPEGPAGPQGPQGPEGPQGAAGPGLVVVDAAGTVIGPFVQILGDLTGDPGVVYFDTGTQLVPLAVYADRISMVSPVTLWFENTSCRGTVYATNGSALGSLMPIRSYVVLPDGQTVAQIDYTPGNEVPGSFVQSRMEYDGSCINQGQPGQAQPLIPVGTLPATSPPYSITVQ